MRAIAFIVSFTAAFQVSASCIDNYDNTQKMLENFLRSRSKNCCHHHRSSGESMFAAFADAAGVMARTLRDAENYYNRGGLKRLHDYFSDKKWWRKDYYHRLDFDFVDFADFITELSDKNKFCEEKNESGANPYNVVLIRKNIRKIVQKGLKQKYQERDK